jgi:hypothetical protein
MDESTGVGGDIADDHEFQVAQDGEVPPEAEAAADEDARAVGDEPEDERGAAEES